MGRDEEGKREDKAARAKKGAKKTKPSAVTAEERKAKFADMRAKAEARSKKNTYVVKSGDSLSKIALELLGDANRWPEIFELNKDQIEDPNLIYPDQKLKIPPK